MGFVVFWSLECLQYLYDARGCEKGFTGRRHILECLSAITTSNDPTSSFVFQEQFEKLHLTC